MCPPSERLALGITAEVESKGLKGSKRKKALKLGEDYMVRAHASR